MLRQFSIETIAKAFDFEVMGNDNSKKPQHNSNMVFGIFFFSRYLLKCWNYINNENLPDDHDIYMGLKEFDLKKESKLKSEDKFKAFIADRKIYIDLGELNESDEKEYIKTFLEYCTNEYFFTFKESTPHIAKMTIHSFKND